jgi:hypothetical protein
MGTDAQYSVIYNPSASGTPCCGFEAAPELVTRGVKAPRLAGLFSASRFLHNGSVGSLDELFCLKPRANDLALGQTSTGHLQTCTGLDDLQKQQLIAYLRSL